MNVKTDITTPYKLNADLSSDRFYEDVERLTDAFLESVSNSFNGTVLSYKKFIQAFKIEVPRSTEEYLIEALMIGVFWTNYISAAIESKRISTSLLKSLYKLRRKLPRLKPAIDTIRGYGITSLLSRSKAESERLPRTIASIQKLIAYLDASGDFSEECTRLRNWIPFLRTLNINDIHFIIENLIQTAQMFSSLASETLSNYTHGVEHFIETRTKDYLNKENLLFVTRPENEYHLNMVCAEILNRAFKEEFDRAEKKIVLLPTCMQNNGNACRAEWKDGEKKCLMCNSKCTIGMLTKKLAPFNVETRLIPHSSQFSLFLEKWKDNKSVGLIGTACVLNLIKGGYEMRKLGIPSQCVFLDYCGCRNHWHPTGISTDLNFNRLLHILSLPKENS